MKKPYYEEEGITIYCADCRDVLPQLEPVDLVLMDPIWPNNSVPQYAGFNPHELFSDICKLLPSNLKRLIIHLGCDSDVRFLSCVPAFLPFLRVCWLDYARPSYKGRLLYSGDVAYAFGYPPNFIKGRQVMSGMCRSSVSDKLFHRHSEQLRKDFTRREISQNLIHPSPRRLQHVKWLVNQFSDTEVIDPLMGSGTSILAAKILGRKAIGIEIEQKYCDIAIERLRQGVFKFEERKFPDNKQAELDILRGK